MNIKVVISISMMLLPFCGLTQTTKNEQSCNVVQNKKNKSMSELNKNVLGGELKIASASPLTGFYRNGYCATGKNDMGTHVVAAVVTEEFLKYSLSKGNDLITPNKNYNFPGLKPGDVWCLCVLRWKEALKANVAPKVILEATHIQALKYVTLEDLMKHANQ